MTFQEFMQNVLYVVATAILPIITAYLVNLIKTKIDVCVIENADNTTAVAIQRVTTLVSDIVKTVNQTYVDSLKKTGIFDKEAQTTAKNMALSMAKSMIAEETKEIIEELYVNFDTYLDTLIESTVNWEKE